MSSSSTSKQPTNYKRWTNLWGENQKVALKLHPNCLELLSDMCVGGVVYLCFCFGFRSRGRQWWREGSGNVPPGSPPPPALCGHCLEATELRVQMCWGWRLALWHSRPRCHGDLKQGPGASSPLTPWGRRPGVWSSAVFPHTPSSSSGDQVDSGGSCPWPSVSTALEASSGDAPPNPFVWPTTYT